MKAKKNSKTDPEGLCGRSECFSFPAVIVDGKGEILHRNRAARGLLPPPWRLRRLLSVGTWKKDTLSHTRLDGVEYFVGNLQEGEYSLLVFLETFLPFHEPFSRYLLRESLEHFRTFCDAAHTLGEREAEKEKKELGDRLIARTERIRRESGAYYRLLTAKDRLSGEKAVCDLPSFFASVKEQLKGVRMEMDLFCPKSLGAEFSPPALIFVILSIVRFIFLFEGEERVRAYLEKRGSKAAVTLLFADGEGIFSAFSPLMDGGENKSLFPHAMGLAPLFSAMVVCRKENIQMTVSGEDKVGKVEILLPGTAPLSEAFLGTEDPKLRLMLEEMIREIFPSDENQ